MDFGKDKKYPSTTTGMITLMQDYEKACGDVEIPITVEDDKKYLYLRDDTIAIVVASHGPDLEF